VRSPPVTWLLPVRNGMPYLTETLASIAAQTYSDSQILAWDNGSTDGTVEELRRWIPGKIRGKLIADQPLGLGEARARLVEESSTELCAWIDADDRCMPERLQLQVQFLTTHPGIAAVGSHIVVIDSSGNSDGVIARFPLEDHEIVAHMLHGPAVAQPSVLFRRSAVMAAGNYRNVGPVNVEDYDMWLRLAIDYRLANIDQPLIEYRVHDTSTTVVAEREGKLKKAAAECFIDCAPLLYGCTHTEARMLAERRHPRAVGVLLRIARSLGNRSERSWGSTLCSPEFLRSAKLLVSERDYTSGAFIQLLTSICRRHQKRTDRRRNAADGKERYTGGNL
jgi:glycosyltransferase involved in cell wall biosynthesis